MGDVGSVQQGGFSRIHQYLDVDNEGHLVAMGDVAEYPPGWENTGNWEPREARDARRTRPRDY